MTLADATALPRSTSARGPAAPPPRSVPPPAPAAPGGRIYLFDRQDAAQTVVMQFLPAPKRAIADYTPLGSPTRSGAAAASARA